MTKHSYHGFVVPLSIFLLTLNAFADTEMHVVAVPDSRELHGTIDHILKGPIEAVWNTLIDVKGYTETMPNAEKSEVIDTKENFIRYYALMNMPWPIADVEYQSDIHMDHDHHMLKFDMVPGTAKGVKNFRATWTLESVPGGTRAMYSLFFELDRHYPQWAMNLGMKSSLGNIMKKLQYHLDKLESDRTTKVSNQK